jgi:hypothetical protein
MPPVWNRNIFLVLFSVCLVAFFTRNTFRNVKDIAPQVLKEPIQTPPYDPRPIYFNRDNYEYSLTPLYDYEINGLVVGKMNYRLFSLYKYESVFPMDLCMIWGKNVSSGVYRNSAVKFSQDCRWCWVQWWGNIEFRMNEMSNNHLLINNSLLESKLKSIVRGDQVQIKGKLVKVDASIPGEPDSRIFWNSSTTRDDNGAGACEVIYVEDIKVLRKANVLSGFLYNIGRYGLLIWLLANIIRIFWPG